MRLYIMRHGPAEDRSPTGRDADRALTPSGRDRVTSVAEELARRGELPRIVVSSPLVRARETADIVAAHAGNLTVEVRQELALGARVRALVDGTVAAQRDRAILIGHQPDLSEAIADLTGASVDFAKAAVAALDFAAGQAPKLAFYLDPTAR